MNGLPVVRPRRLIRALERAGFVVHHVRGSHYYLRHPEKPGLLVTVPYHNSPLRTDSLPLVSKIYWPQNADDAIMDAP